MNNPIRFESGEFKAEAGELIQINGNQEQPGIGNVCVCI